jgi:hypothetical protein
MQEGGAGQGDCPQQEGATAAASRAQAAVSGSRQVRPPAALPLVLRRRPGRAKGTQAAAG